MIHISLVYCINQPRHRLWLNNVRVIMLIDTSILYYIVPFKDDTFHIKEKINDRDALNDNIFNPMVLQTLSFRSHFIS